MGKPMEIKNMNDVLNELVAVSSSLNMYIFDSDEDKKLDVNSFITDTTMGKHAMLHLENVIEYIKKGIK